MELEGATCLVTGGNRGIGLAVARRLAREPVRLLVGVRELDRYVPVEGAAVVARGRGKVVDNSSIVGYVHLPGVSTYSAAKAGVAAFTESLRRELAATPLSTLHVVTGGIDTDMLDAAKEELGDAYPGAESWDQHTPDGWADKIVDAILADDEVLGPGGKAAIGKLASHLPRAVFDTFAGRAFDRRD